MCRSRRGRVQMPSPFPGMNPYLEQPDVWEMFHTQLISALQQYLTSQLRPRYHVRIEQRTFSCEMTYRDWRWAGGTAKFDLPAIVGAKKSEKVVPPMIVRVPDPVRVARIPQLII